MIPGSSTRAVARRQRGSALLLVMFLIAVMLISATAVMPNLLTAGRREKEDELIWRGGQYARAIRLYHRKNNKFPQNVDDLVKPKNGMRFLRQAYKDPMNREDGSWRFIYVGPGGQIIGSLKQRSVLQSAGSVVIGQRQNPATASASGGAQDQIQAQVGTQSGQPATQATPAATETSATSDDLTGKVFGGSIIGVGSKVKRKSIKTFDGSTIYREWEFLYDPAKEALGGAVQPPAGQGLGAPANPQKQQQQ